MMKKITILITVVFSCFFTYGQKLKEYIDTNYKIYMLLPSPETGWENFASQDKYVYSHVVFTGCDTPYNYFCISLSTLSAQDIISYYNYMWKHCCDSNHEWEHIEHERNIEKNPKTEPLKYILTSSIIRVPDSVGELSHESQRKMTFLLKHKKQYYFLEFNMVMKDATAIDKEFEKNRAMIFQIAHSVRFDD